MRNFNYFRKKLQNLFSRLIPIPGKIRGTSFPDFKDKVLPRKLIIKLFISKSEKALRTSKTSEKKNHESLKIVCLNFSNPSLP